MTNLGSLWLFWSLFLCFEVLIGQYFGSYSTRNWLLGLPNDLLLKRCSSSHDVCLCRRLHLKRRCLHGLRLRYQHAKRRQVQWQVFAAGNDVAAGLTLYHHRLLGEYCLDVSRTDRCLIIWCLLAYHLGWLYHGSLRSLRRGRHMLSGVLGDAGLAQFLLLLEQSYLFHQIKVGVTSRRWSTALSLLNY